MPTAAEKKLTSWQKRAINALEEGVKEAAAHNNHALAGDYQFYIERVKSFNPREKAI